MDNIIQNRKECYVCGTTQNLHSHHCIYGTSNRKNSEKYGLKVWLCYEHHLGHTGVHRNIDLDRHLKKVAQEHFEAEYGSSTVQRMYGSSTVQEMYDRSTVQEMCDRSTVQKMYGNSIARHIEDGKIYLATNTQFKIERK